MFVQYPVSTIYGLYKREFETGKDELEGFLQVLEIQGGVHTLSFAPATIQ